MNRIDLSRINKYHIALFIFGLIALLSLLTGCGSTPAATPLPTMTPIIQPTTTPVIQPTDTPEPPATDTPEPPPTDTPEPTNTPLPTKALSSPDEYAYAQQVIGWMGEYSPAFSKFSDLASDPQLYSQSWKMQVATQLAQIQVTSQHIRDASAPPRLAGIHSKLKSAAGHFMKFTQYAADGIDQQDSELLGQAVSEMKAGQRDIQSANALLDTLNH